MKDRNKEKITTSATKSLFQKEINLRINLFFWQNLHEIIKSVEFKVDKHIFPKFFVPKKNPTKCFSEKSPSSSNK
jgi:hypothetical protein